MKFTKHILLAGGLAGVGYGVYQSRSAVMAVVVGTVLCLLALSASDYDKEAK